MDEEVAEIHAIRRQICEECDNDFSKIGERLNRRQAEHPELLVERVQRAEADTSGSNAGDK